MITPGQSAIHTLGPLSTLGAALLLVAAVRRSTKLAAGGALVLVADSHRWVGESCRRFGNAAKLPTSPEELVSST